MQIRFIRIFVHPRSSQTRYCLSVPAPRARGPRPASRLWTAERWTRVSAVLRDQPPAALALLWGRSRGPACVAVTDTLLETVERRGTSG